jgi:hypothetical protein
LIEEVFVTQNVTRVRFESLFYIRGKFLSGEVVCWDGNFSIAFKELVDLTPCIPISVGGKLIRDNKTYFSKRWWANSRLANPPDDLTIN